MAILGVNAFHGDSSAALFRNGQLVSAIAEEGLNRIQHWAGFPAQSIEYCLDGHESREITDVAISRDPKAHLADKIVHAAMNPGLWPSLYSRSHNIIRIGRLADSFRSCGIALRSDVRIHSVEHHRAYMAGAFFASPFDEAAVLSVDRFGDFSSVMWGVGRGNKIEVLGSVSFPHSLGIFYTAFTQFLGFNKYGDEHKVMGLAAYGEPRFMTQVRDVIQTHGFDCKLNLDYFTHHSMDFEMAWDNAEPILGPVYSHKLIQTFGAPRTARSEILPRHRDLAASVQAVLEENYFELLHAVHKATRQNTICLAGDVALNCAANGKIFARTPFKDVYIQAATHDAGTSIGAALYVQHQVLDQPRRFSMSHAYYGPEYGLDEVRASLDDCGTKWHEINSEALIALTAAEIAAGKIVGWFQGRMEFGPFALGNRSILADPRSLSMKDTLNRRIKYREPFRPFCSSILAEAIGDYFKTSYSSPFMVQAYGVKASKQDLVPAITHADGTGQLQTVERRANPLYWKLIDAFRQLTGVPVLLNSSFNENEPIVNTPRQAIECFLRTHMDALVIGPYLLYKTENLHRNEERKVFAEATTA